MSIAKILRTFWHRPDIPAASRDEYRAFLENHQRRTMVPLIVLGTSIMVALVLFDWMIVPDVIAASVMARILVAVPVAVATGAFFLSGRRSLNAYYAAAVALPVLYGFLACLVLAGSVSPLAPFYFSANNITVMFAILILGLPPLLAAVSGLAVIAVQTVLLISAPYATGELILLVTAISLLLAASAFFGNWRMDLDRRRHFLARQRDLDQMRDLAAQNALLARLSALDPLTGLSNRRGLDAVLRSAVRDLLEHPEQGAGLALAMIDVDHFKLFNDTLGHTAGDEALHQIGRALSRAGPECELAARFGGEEFMIVMPDASALGLEMTAARLRASVERLAIAHPTSPTSRLLTVSIGIVHVEEDVLRRREAGAPAERALIAAADAALYLAKAKGRNTYAIERIEHLEAVPGSPLKLADAS